MQIIRLIVKQNKAHYRKAESDTNKMTYPLPPFSTIIGALHNACGYTEYHEMDISVQGRYHSMQREIYVDHVRLNSLQDDRGILIKLNNPAGLSAGYSEIGVALRQQGNSFRKNITVSITNQKLYRAYIDLKEQEDKLAAYHKEIIKPQLADFMARIKQLKAALKSLNSEDDNYSEVQLNLDDLVVQKNKLESDYKAKKETLTHQLARFATLTKSIKSYEVLYDVELVIHIKADETVLADIENNIYNLTAIGRSEDFIDLIEIKRVTLSDDINQEYQNTNYMAYIDKGLISSDAIFTLGGEKTAGVIPVYGTVYHIDKDYRVVDNKRLFNHKKVCLVSKYAVDQDSESIYVDDDGYIVSLN